MKSIIRIIILLFAALFTYTVYLNWHKPYYPVIWILIILSYLFTYLDRETIGHIKNYFSSYKTILLLLLCLLLPVMVRVLYYQPGRIHGDDIITAYFSATYDSHHMNFFAPVPENSGQWVSQFPSLFFLLQKIFLKIFGSSVLTVKLSVLPYVALTGLFTYLTARLFCGRLASLIALVFYSTFAPALYLETLGLHFIASCAAAMICFYALTRSVLSRRKIWFCLTGLTCGLCYLFYTSSYIALPVCFLFYLFASLRHFRQILAGTVVFVLGFLIVTAPFGAYMLKHRTFYIAGRTNQVSLLTGSWSEYTQKENRKSFSTILGNQIGNSLKSLAIDNIGGHGGYNFGHLALFDPVSLITVSGGIITVIILMFKNPAASILILIPLFTFITGVVLTIPPPALHRLSLAFPYFSILSALPFYTVIKVFKKPLIPVTTGFLLITAYLSYNLLRTKLMLNSETNNESLSISRMINTRFPGRHVHVASFPGFAFEKIYYFSENKTSLTIDTNYHNNYLEKFKPNEPYIYIIIFPKTFSEKFLSVDPDAEIVYTSDNFAVTVNRRTLTL
jgi:hypothetical protein